MLIYQNSKMLCGILRIINDYSVILDNNIYMPGTANHELGHVADGLAGSRKIQDFDSGKEYITNTYLNYLANSNNTYGNFNAIRWCWICRS